MDISQYERISIDELVTQVNAIMGEVRFSKKGHLARLQSAGFPKAFIVNPSGRAYAAHGVYPRFMANAIVSIIESKQHPKITTKKAVLASMVQVKEMLIGDLEETIVDLKEVYLYRSVQERPINRIEILHNIITKYFLWDIHQDWSYNIMKIIKSSFMDDEKYKLLECGTFKQSIGQFSRDVFPNHLNEPHIDNAC